MFSRIKNIIKETGLSIDNSILYNLNSLKMIYKTVTSFRIDLESDFNIDFNNIKRQIDSLEIDKTETNKINSKLFELTKTHKQNLNSFKELEKSILELIKKIE